MTALFNEPFTKDTVCGLLKYREQHSLKEWVEQWKCSCSYNIMFYSSFYERNSSFLSVLQNNTMCHKTTLFFEFLHSFMVYTHWYVFRYKGRLVTNQQKCNFLSASLHFGSPFSFVFKRMDSWEFWNSVYQKA